MSATSDAGAPRKRPAASRAAALETVARAVQVLDRVRVEPSPVSSDGFRDRPRVRGEQEGGEVDPAAIELELRPHRAPVAQVGRSRARLGELRPADRKSAGRETGSRKKSAPG